MRPLLAFAIFIAGAMPAAFAQVTRLDYSFEDDGLTSVGEAMEQITLDGGGTLTFAVSGTLSGGFAFNAPISVTIDGAGQDVRIAGGISMGYPNCKLINLTIIGASGAGVALSGSNCEIRDCKIGTDGATALPNNTGNSSTSGGLRISGANNLVTGCIISGNNRAGVVITGESATGNRIADCIIGLNAAGTAAIPNTEYGIHLRNGAKTNYIGGPDISYRNVISGNTMSGIRLEFDNDNTEIFNNFIGTDVTGATAIGNGEHGIIVGSEASGNKIGSSTVGTGNIISGNGKSGIQFIGDNCTGNDVLNNYIGLSAAGNTVLGNTEHGVVCESQTYGNNIGSTGVRNFISGNGIDGIRLADSDNNLVRFNTIGLMADEETPAGNGGYGIRASGVAPDNLIGAVDENTGNIVCANTLGGIYLDFFAGENFVLRNRIGTNGTDDIGNQGHGIYCAGSSNIIGEPSRGNIIAGNEGDGIHFESFNAGNNVVTANWIGVNEEQTALPNAGGISIGANCFDNKIDRNLISGNTSAGILVSGANALRTSIIGNFIGTSSTGMAVIPNNQGIVLQAGADDTRIGDGDPEYSNVISGNVAQGIEVAGAEGAVIERNYIGTDLTGTLALPNGTGLEVNTDAATLAIGGGNGRGNIISGNSNHGILVGDSSGIDISGNIIGADTTGMLALPNGGDGVHIDGTVDDVYIGPQPAGPTNHISGNAGDGIHAAGAVTNLVVQQNLVGADGSRAAALPNTGDGIVLDGCTGALIGGTTTEGNLISGNGANGIRITGGATESAVKGNTIGLNQFQNAVLGNELNGVLIEDSATNNTIGGTAANENNVICGSGAAGVRITGDGTDGNTVQANLIGINPGQEFMGNATAGVMLDGGAADNLIGTSGDGANQISGNTEYGVVLEGAGTSANQISNNYIGTNDLGSGALANGFGGIHIYNGASNNVVKDSLISANNGPGVQISDAGTSGNHIYNCIIGGNLDDTNGLPNLGDGVLIEDGAKGNTIGGYDVGGNTIRNNTGSGIKATDADTLDNTFAGNAIFNHNNPGINLEFGANNDMPAPVVLRLNPKIAGTAAPDAIVELFADDFDEGRLYLDRVTANSNGEFISNFDLSSYTFLQLTATATDVDGNTSEFSAPFFIGCAPPYMECPANIHVFVEEGAESTQVTVPTPAVAPGHPCLYPIAGISNNFNNTSDASGVYSLGVTEVRWTAVDSNGGEGTCTMTITVTAGSPDGEGDGAPEGEGQGEAAGEGEGEAVNEGEGEGAREAEQAEYHSADLDSDYRIDLSDLLRGIQLYAVEGYQCEAKGISEDGYVPGAGAAHSCDPHDSDYAEQDWVVSLGELLRLIQLYNATEYIKCAVAEGESEDGWCLLQ